MTTTKGHYVRESKSSRTFAELQHFMYRVGHELLPGIPWHGSVDEVIAGHFQVTVTWTVNQTTATVSALYDEDGPEGRRLNAIQLWVGEQIGTQILAQAAERSRSAVAIDGEAVEA